MKRNDELKLDYSYIENVYNYEESRPFLKRKVLKFLESPSFAQTGTLSGEERARLDYIIHSEEEFSKLLQFYQESLEHYDTIPDCNGTFRHPGPVILRDAFLQFIAQLSYSYPPLRDPIHYFKATFMQTSDLVNFYELKKLLLILYESALNPGAHVATFRLKHLHFPLSAHDKQHLYNLTVNKKDFDRLMTAYMIELDEDLFLKEGYIEAPKFISFASKISAKYEYLSDYVEEFKSSYCIRRYANPEYEIWQEKKKVEEEKRKLEEADAKNKKDPKKKGEVMEQKTEEEEPTPPQWIYNPMYIKHYTVNELGYFLLPIYQNSLLNSTQNDNTLGAELVIVLNKFGDTYKTITDKINPDVTVRGKTIKPFYRLKFSGEILKSETQVTLGNNLDDMNLQNEE